MRTLFLTLMMSFLSHISFGADDEDDECCICMRSLSKDRQRLGCSHDKFHAECINKWLTHNPSCPLCRTGEVNPAPESFGRFLFENNIGGTVGALIAIGFIGGQVLFVIFISNMRFPN
jgi:hypothetical protein